MRLLWTVCICLFLFSCQFSMTRKEKVKDQIPPPSLNASIKKSLATPFFKTGNWPKQNWWTTFHSPELNAFIQMSIENNPSLEEAKRRLEMARQEAIVTRSALFPLVTMTGEFTHEYLSHYGLYRALNPEIPLNANLSQFFASLYYDFDIWGKNRNLFYSSIGRVMTQRAETAQVELQLTTALAETFFLLKTNLIKKRLLEELIKVKVGINDLQEKMLKSALFSAFEPYLGTEKILETQKQIEAINDDIEVNKHLLNILMGRSPDCPIITTDIVLPLTECIDLPCDLSIGLLARRPDLMAQIWKAEAVAYLVGASIADYYPDVSITAFLGFESGIKHNLLSAQAFNWGVTPAFNLPIFTAGAITANVSAKKAEYDATIFAYNQMLLNSAKEVADLLSNAKTIFKQKIEQEEIVVLAKKRLDLVILNVKSGLDSKFSNLGYKAAWLETQIEDVSLLYKQYFVTIMLIRALGGGFSCL